MDKLNDLKQFCRRIIAYQKLVRRWAESFSISAELRENIQSLRTELQRGYSRLESTIMQYGGTDFKQDMFYSAFDPFSSNDVKEKLNTLYKVIQIVNKTIGKLEVEGESREVELPKKPEKVTKQPSEDTAKSPIQLFDAMQLHPKVIEASKSCFTTTNYREAILNAFISLIDYIKEISKLDLDGDNLMNTVFSFNYDKEQRKITKYPLIRINELKNKTDRDEQFGFMFLCKGAAAFIRNPKAHKIIPQLNPLNTLEYLAFASLLMRILEKSTAVKTRPTKINEEIFLARCQEGGHENVIELYLKAKALGERRFANGDFINWGVSGYSYRMPWKNYPNGETLFVAFCDGKLQIWPDLLRRKSSGEAGEKYWEKLRSIPSLAREFSSVSKHKYPTISTDNMKEPDIDAFIEAIEKLGHGLDEISKEHSS